MKDSIRRFVFAAEFTGDVAILGPNASEVIDALEKNPESFLESSHTVEDVALRINVSGAEYLIEMNFTVSMSDSEDFWVNGGTSDVIDNLEGGLPFGELTLAVNGQKISPDQAIFQRFG
jgi:hypothetical protein